MKPRYIFISLAVAALGLQSCNDYLELTPNDRVSETTVWSNPKYAQQVINHFYGFVQNMGNFNSYQSQLGITEGLTDVLKYGSSTVNASQGIPNTFSYGGVALQTSFVNVYMGNSPWSGTYVAIRRINEALGNLHRSTFDDATKTRMEGEMRFFRGWCYYELLKRWGQAIMYDEDLTQINTNHALGTAEEGWQRVYDDLKYAGENLPVSTDPKGRITSGAAWAMMSRAMLYCDNWQAVKEAAEHVFGMGYALTPTYAEAFTDANSEDILQYTYDGEINITNNYDAVFAPGGDKAADGNRDVGGYGTPTQEMVEEYEMADGSRFDWQAYYDKAKNGTTEAPPYDRLEPRFQATVLYNGAKWKGRTIEPYVDGADGWAEWFKEPAVNGRTTTGYYLRKLVDENHHFSDRQGGTQPWIALRLAEVYLNYAEACYRLGDEATAREYINKVRARVSLPALKAGVSGDELFKALRHERKVELAYESLYYWDMRRWHVADKELTGIRRHGFKIEKTGSLFKYTYVEVDRENLNFPTKLYRFPIPDGELNNNNLVEQFPEWR